MQIVKLSPSSRRQSSPENDLLAALPPEVYERLQPHLEPVLLPVGLAIHEPGDAQEYVYFPTDCIVSFLYGMEDGSTAEIAVVGHEGMVGTSMIIGGGGPPSRAVVASTGNAFRLRASVLKAEFERGSELQHLLLCFMQARLAQTAQTVICTRYHTVEQQLCRWLLWSLDRVSSNTLTMTQELISNMLGVRREGVTEAARHLQAAGLIRYTRGHITVLDRLKLEEKACECYAVVKKEYGRLLPKVLAHAAERRPVGSYPATA
jgi:CRP-like cAMP-binding protein